MTEAGPARKKKAMKKIAGFIITIPGQPVGKARARVTRSGHAFTPKKTEVAEATIRQLFVARYPDAEPIIGPVAIDITAFLGIPRSHSEKRKQLMLIGEILPTQRPDVDNIGKLICDALESIAYHNDSQVVLMLIKKIYSLTPRLEIRIKQKNERGSS